MQPALRVGDVAYNLQRVEELVRDAVREHEPDVVVLPEAVTSPNLYARSLRHAARPVDGEPYLLLQRLARELGVTVGAGFHAVRGEDCYGTFALVEPDGAAYLHDKDIPTCWEHNYYTRGDDDGVVQTKLGPVGLVCGWEWARARTARRLRGRVDLVLGGMCWPSFPDWLLTRPYLVWRERPIQRELARDTPGLMARLTGVPVVMASHVGDVEADSPMMPGIRWRSPMIGETQICDRDGRILARLTYEDGEGHVSAEVDLRGPAPLDRVPDRFWAPLMPLSVHMVWHPYNLHGRVKYQALKLLRRHPWQTAAFTDLPNHVPAEQAPEILGEGGAEDPFAAHSGAQGNGRVEADPTDEDGAAEDGGDADGGELQDDPETRWYCDACGWIYDPEEGDEDGGIPAGTAFEDIPDDWMCPVCGARKKDFRALQPGEEVPA